MKIEISTKQKNGSMYFKGKYCFSAVVRFLVLPLLADVVNNSLRLLL